MKKKYYLITFLSLLLITCCGGKKQTLESEKATITPQDSIQRSVVVYNAAEDIKPEKVEEPIIGGGKVVSPHLVKLNLGSKKLEEKEINLDDFYKKVSYVELKHPLADKGFSFLGDTNIKIYTRHENGESSLSMRGFNSSVYLTEDNIIAGDNYLGYHVYDREGVFLCNS